MGIIIARSYALFYAKDTGIKVLPKTLAMRGFF